MQDAHLGSALQRGRRFVPHAGKRAGATTPAATIARDAAPPHGRFPAPAAAATVLACAGCGSSHSSGTTIDPASAVPATAPLYASATVRPDGALQSAARAAGRALTRQADPYLRLLGALQTPGSPALDFK